MHTYSRTRRLCSVGLPHLVALEALALLLDTLWILGVDHLHVVLVYSLCAPDNAPLNGKFWFKFVGWCCCR